MRKRRGVWGEEKTLVFSQGPPADTKRFFVLLGTDGEAFLCVGGSTDFIDTSASFVRERPAVNAGRESHLPLDIGTLSRGERRSCLGRTCWREGGARV
ncbi:hypothetical protein ROHU_031198 [Labeo rohita]|uniref:Uncharacterized protein n=1 Tax=Labeo rohita TaxID=84645 RepID=A0A498LN09_LABRO|nr:hypothetical protein ROHU_031198 [Labeo rohita]